MGRQAGHNRVGIAPRGMAIGSGCVREAAWVDSLESSFESESHKRLFRWTLTVECPYL